MPEHIRAFIVILTLSTIGFFVAKKLFQTQVTEKEFSAWRNIWFVSTTIAFLSGNFWIYALITSAYIHFIFKKVDNKISIFFIFLFVIPPVGQAIPGLGLVNYLVTIDQIRLASLVILMPIAIQLSRNNKFKFPKTSTDVFILLYVMILISLAMRDTTFTDAMRTAFYTYTDILLPYYVASRGIKNIEQMKTIAIAIITAAVAVAFIATFEHIKGWLLYRAVQGVLGQESTNQVLQRSGSIRSIASLLQPIVLGYFMFIALGFYLFISNYIEKNNIKRIGFAILILGLYVPVSRGPWVGAMLMVLVFLGLGPSALKRLSTLAFCAILLLPTLTIIPGGEKYLNLIPFVGETEKSTITYRQDLYKNSVIVIEKNPLFGSTNYILEPEMQALKINGIIDIVNSYLRIALETGYVGLIVFIGIFLTALMSMYKQMRRIKDKNDEYRALLRSMIGILLGIMATIATVSSIGVVPIIYWLMIGISIGACQIIKSQLYEKTLKKN
jgi:O-antigen ligase